MIIFNRDIVMIKHIRDNNQLSLTPDCAVQSESQSHSVRTYAGERANDLPFRCPFTLYVLDFKEGE